MPPRDPPLAHYYASNKGLGPFQGSVLGPEGLQFTPYKHGLGPNPAVDGAAAIEGLLRQAASYRRRKFLAEFQPLDTSGILDALGRMTSGLPESGDYETLGAIDAAYMNLLKRALDEQR